LILVDGFNVLHVVLLGKDREGGWWKEASRERLLRRASLWPEAADEVWVAFDGRRPAWSVWSEPVAQVVSGAARGAPGPIVHSLYVESADDWIVRRARRSPRPERTIVVTGDHKVAGRARSARCEVWSPWTFVSQCPETERPVSPGVSPSCDRSTTD
jgi:hypothetical protein